MKTKLKALLLVGGALLGISGASCASRAGDSNDYRNKPSESAGTAGSRGKADPSMAEGGDSGGAAGDSGGSDDGADTPENPTKDSSKDIATVCAEYAAAECHKIAQCNPWFIAAYFEDEAACVKRYATTSGCLAWFGLRGTSQTVAALEACTLARTRSTCAEWLDEDPVALAACIAKPGALADGSGCGHDDQCQSGHCSFSDECGVCGPKSEAGNDCRGSGDCAAGLICRNQVCGRQKEAGVPCDGASDCPNSLTCSGGHCAAPKGAGETCTENACDGHAGVYCVDGVCRKLQYAAPGEPCDWSSGIDCAAGGFCRITGSSTQGTCVLPAKDGQACDDQDGPSCLPWATCTGGLCKVSDPAACR